MCEEWYCRGLGHENEPPMSGLLGSSARGTDSVTDSAPATPSIEIPSSGGNAAAVAAVQMSMSPPKGRAKNGFSLFDATKLAVPTPPFLKRNKSDLSLGDGAAAAGQAAVAAGSRTSSEDSADTGGGGGRRTGLQVKIPEDVRRLQPKTSEDGTPLSIGPYELVIKERMMGCYLACYVWRGCLDRVQGVSRGHVKSGLLSGRVGNKGGCGVSLKLGETRLLFVNTHLAGE